MEMLEQDLREDCMITGKKHPSAEEETPRVPKCPNGHALVSLGTSRDNGWACDGRATPGGCKRGCTDFRQSAGWPRFRCERCDWDLCDKCVAAIGPLPAGTGPSGTGAAFRLGSGPPIFAGASVVAPTGASGSAPSVPSSASSAAGIGAAQQISFNVSGAAWEDCNGRYEADGTRDGVPSYRLGSSSHTITRRDGRWWMDSCK